jgi:acetylornithine deacetylase/succinyl-diaminopimelate desuccinylase-like protein
MKQLLIGCAALVLGAGSTGAEEARFYTKDYQQQALEIYRHIISIRSAAGHGKVPEVAEYLAAQFREGGFDEDDVHVLRQTLSTGEEAAALVVRYRGDGSSGRKPILLIAHMDVVDAIPSDWERDPFTLVEENGYFYGRGTVDDKFGITELTSTFLRFKSEGFVPTRDLVIGFTGDEETLMETTQALANEHRDLTDAEYVLNADGGGGVLTSDGRPAYYLLQAAEKTYASFELTARNPGGHSSLPRDDNAIYDLAAALRNIQAYRFPVQVNEITRGYFEAAAPFAPEHIGKAMRAFAKDPNDVEAQEVLAAAPTEIGVTRTTCVATLLKAGHAENALPQSATATINCRIFPGESIESVRDKLFEVAGNPELEIVTLADPVPSPASELNEEVTAAVTDAIHELYGEIPIIPSMAPYGTDGKHMRLAGMPTYGVMGVFSRPEDEFTHGLNERVSVKVFYNALEYWHRLLTDLAGR